METTKRVALDDRAACTVTKFPVFDQRLPNPADRRRAIRHALIQIQSEAIDLGMPLTGHLADAAAEAAAEECY